MAYPLAFTAFTWEDLPAEGTPLDKEDLQEAERRLAEFATEYEIHWRSPVKKESELPKVEVIKGDVFLVEETKELVVWTGAEYVKLAVPYWQAPVTEEAKLPTENNTIGDVRLDLATNQFFICYATVGTIEEQWKEFVSTDTSKHVHTIETLTWSVAEEVTPTPEIVPGGFRRVAAASEETAHLYEVEASLLKGEAEFELLVEGTPVKHGGSSVFKVTTEAKAFVIETPPSLVAKDKLELVVVSVAEEPSGLAFSAFVEHIAKAI